MCWGSSWPSGWSWEGEVSQARPTIARCVYCGRTADPRVGGRPKCVPCTLYVLGSGTLMLIVIVIAIVRLRGIG